MGFDGYMSTPDGPPTHPVRGLAGDGVRRDTRNGPQNMFFLCVYSMKIGSISFSKVFLVERASNSAPGSGAPGSP